MATFGHHPLADFSMSEKVQPLGRHWLLSPMTQMTTKHSPAIAAKYGAIAFGLRMINVESTMTRRTPNAPKNQYALTAVLFPTYGT